MLSHDTAAEIHGLTDKRSARIWPDVTGHRCRTAAEVAALLRARGWKGTLRPCGPGCTAAGPAEKKA